MKRIKAKGVKVVVYEPELEQSYFFGSEAIRDLHEFKKMSSVIVANRLADCLNDVAQKCFFSRHLRKR